MGQQKNASRMSYIAFAVIALAWDTNVHAQSKKGVSAPPSSPAPAAAQVKPVKDEDKVDISDLESKYWAPKDTDFSVVQNRTYSKVKYTGLMIAPQFGTVINDPYSEGNVFGLTANWFWSERMGLQATWLQADLSNNDATNDIGRLSATAGATPDHGKLTGYYGVGLNIVPFYAKMSFWGKRIIYFDMAFTPTIGMTSYEQQIEGAPKGKSAFTYGIDVTQFFFFSRWFAIRADLKNNWYTQEVVKYRNTAPFVKGQKVKDKDIQDTMFLLGAEFYF